MEVILLERVEKLGQMGDIVRVKTGFARNYLLPQRKAIRSSKENLVLFESQRGQLEAKNLEQRNEAAAVAKKFDGLTVTVIRQAGENGQLYGSVTNRDVAESVTEAGFSVARGQIRLDRPIKTLGMHKLRVALHPEVNATVSVNVAKSEEEAAAQLSDSEGGSAEPADGEPAADATLAVADSVEAEGKAAGGLVEEQVAEKLAEKAEGEAENPASGSNEAAEGENS